MHWFPGGWLALFPGRAYGKDRRRCSFGQVKAGEKARWEWCFACLTRLPGQRHIAGSSVLRRFQQPFRKLHGTGFGKKNGGQDEIDGRLSFKEFEEADIAFDGAFGYVKEQLALTADEKYSYDDVEKIVKENGGEIVGCIEFTNDYQLEFSGTDYDGLLEKKEKDS